MTNAITITTTPIPIQMILHVLMIGSIVINSLSLFDSGLR